jgi:signal peptidase II
LKKALSSKLWVIALLGLDALTKALVLKWVPPLNGSVYPFGGIGLFENFYGMNFSLNFVVNTGVAWGVFPNHYFLLLSLRLCVIAAMLGYLLFFRSSASSRTGLWLIVAGALGNIIDMFCYGHVIDFFHWQICGWSFPIFNIADSCITCGVFLVLLWPSRNKHKAVDAS